MARAHRLNKDNDPIDSGKYDLLAGYWRTTNEDLGDGGHWIIVPKDAMFEGR